MSTTRMTFACRPFACRLAVVLHLLLVGQAPNQRATAFSWQVLPRAARSGRRAGLGGVTEGRARRCNAMGFETRGSSPTAAAKQRSCKSRHAGSLRMVASNPMDVAKDQGRPRPDEPSMAAPQASPSTASTSLRPRLPAERDINNAMNGFNAGVVNFLKSLMVQYYGERTYARFYALETIARVPYFGYLCVLHLYETLGQWRQAEYLKVHFAESYNELHHLLIMEELGGNVLFRDRWFAQHAAFFYFFVVVGLYLSNPRNAYNLNQHVEEHAFSTYDSFLSDNAESLKEQPAPKIAQKYYGKDKLYVFNGLHNDPDGPSFEERDLARPVISNLFDTFVAVRNDEWEHVKTMKALQQDVSSERE